MLYRDISVFISYFKNLKVGDFFIFKNKITNGDICGIFVDINHITLVFIDRYGEKQCYDIEDIFVKDGEFKAQIYTEDELKEKDIGRIKQDFKTDISFFIKEQEEIIKKLKSEYINKL